MIVGIINIEKIRGKKIFPLLYFLAFSGMVEIVGALILKFSGLKPFFV